MGGLSREHINGADYHVIFRGNEGKPLFLDDDDRETFYKLIELALNKYGGQVHAFCCMTNHVHILLQVDCEPTSKFTQWVCAMYARIFNLKYERKGHLFHRPHAALLVDTVNYFAELVRYIHLNPVRAGIVKSPTDYTWSGHNAYLGKGHIPWLTREKVYGLCENDDIFMAIKNYQQFILDGMGMCDEVHEVMTRCFEEKSNIMMKKITTEIISKLLPPFNMPNKPS